MLRRILVDQFLCEKEDVSINAAIIFDVMLKLMNHSQIQKKEFGGKIYTVLYRNMILKQIEHFKISTRTLSKAITELEDAQLIECIDKNTAPAYITTPKADEYNFLPNGGEFDISANQPKKEKKTQLLSLGKLTRIDQTTEEYRKLLQEKAKEHAGKAGVDFKETYQAFLNHHSAKGTKFVNWLSAYRKWCENNKKWNEKSNEDRSGDMYQ